MGGHHGGSGVLVMLYVSIWALVPQVCWLHENSWAPRLTSAHSSVCTLNFVKSLLHKRTGSCSQAPTLSILGGLPPLPPPQPEPPANSRSKSRQLPGHSATIWRQVGDWQWRGVGGMECPAFIFSWFAHFPLISKQSQLLLSNAPNGISPTLIHPKHADFSGRAPGSTGPSIHGTWLKYQPPGTILQSLHGCSSSRAKKSLTWAGALLLESQCRLWLPSTSLPKLSGGSSWLSGILGSSMNFPMWLVWGFPPFFG